MAKNNEISEETLKQWTDYHQDSLKHWRAWGSWFSWGSPVGLGLFFVEACAAVWLLAQAFGWGS